jgi:hypothetical protein
VASVTAAIRTTFRRYADGDTQGTFVEVFDEAFEVLASGFTRPEIPPMAARAGAEKQR